MPTCNPVGMKPDVYNPIDVENLMAGHCSAAGLRMSEKAEAVQRLTRRGKGAAEIAEAFGMSQRQVQRLRTVEVRAPEPVTFDHSQSRMTELALLTRTARRFADEMRDDVESIWFELLDMEPQRMRELVMVLAAMVPAGVMASELLKWVGDLMPDSEVA